ncbi:zinc-ribbon domain-containing protein [Limosilactobacillus sp. pH52_RY]|uniref:zinc-ribbon domain-containing protein n=1 Tax=Limosilactobacillus balticus TaxID=2759747 RepID=UPI0015FC5E70|nr:zinc-ribbon domain-containing protein [Limosilactobacillus balticus]MBB1109303.1 zinc-ribbon domain-containing protein [Limosilactobacillus balticus]
MKSFFCPKCGTKLSEGTKFCPKCGTNVQKVLNFDKGRSQFKIKNYNNGDERKFNNVFLKKNKLMYLLLLSLIIIFFIWGHIYYSEENQLSRAIKALGDPNENASKYVTTTNSRVKIDNQSVKGIQNYFQKYPDDLNTMQNYFENGKSYSLYRFTPAGRALLFWKRYKVQVDPVYITVNTDQRGMDITMDGQKIGKVNNNNSNSDNNTSDVNQSSNDDSYSKEFGPYLPGLHKFVGIKEVDGHKVKSVVTSSDTNITMNNGISNSTAQSLLEYAFTDNVEDHDEIFTNGQNNKYYKQLVDMYQGYDKDDNIINYDQRVNVDKVIPISNRRFKVDYQVKYVFKNKIDDDTNQKKIQIFKYTATIIKTNDTNVTNFNGLKIQDLGHARKVSESSEND